MRSFFDEENRMTKISKIGDPLEVLNAIIKWEMFRDILKKNIMLIGFSQQAAKLQPPVPALQRAGRGCVCG